MKFYLSIAFASLLLSPVVHADRMFENWDANGDGVLVKEEIPEGPRAIFDKKDTNGDGKITLEEHLAPMGGGERPPRPEERPERPSNAEVGNFEKIEIEQTWHQEPDGFTRTAFVRPPTAGDSTKAPVVIFLHGNGGQADRVLQGWARELPSFYLIAAQGYERSWNIHGEKSEADDVAFFEELVAAIGTKYEDADLDNVSVVGTSNGGGFIHRLMIDLEDPLFQKAIPMVSSMLELQHHDDSFWTQKPGETDYTVKVTPTIRPEILYFHGTKDEAVPYDGGMRQQELHLSAPDTGHIWAQSRGWTKGLLTEGDDSTDGLIVYEYEGTDVTFVEVVDGNHGLGPHQRAARAMTLEFIEGE